MRPLTVVTLMILGSCFAIMVSLGGVIIVVLVLGDEYPRLQREFDPLLESISIFVAMTLISALSFYTLLKKSAVRYWVQLAMWGGRVLTGWHYWPNVG